MSEFEKIAEEYTQAVDKLKTLTFLSPEYLKQMDLVYCLSRQIIAMSEDIKLANK